MTWPPPPAHRESKRQPCDLRGRFGKFFGERAAKRAAKRQKKRAQRAAQVHADLAAAEGLQRGHRPSLQAHPWSMSDLHGGHYPRNARNY